MPKPSPKRPATKNKAQVVIGSGQLANRKVSFIEQVGLRPTGVRLRKSLFDRIRHLRNSHVFLDGFAGSGVLGLTALSEGFQVQFAESNKRAAQMIKTALTDLQLAAPIHRDAAEIEFSGQPFILYVDPPFQELTWYSKIQEIALKHWLEGSFLILEHPKTFEPEALAPLQKVRQKRYGEVIITDLSTD